MDERMKGKVELGGIRTQNMKTHEILNAKHFVRRANGSLPLCVEMR